MRTRRHHNNEGRRQIQRGKLVDRTQRLASQMGVPYGDSLGGRLKALRKKHRLTLAVASSQADISLSFLSDIEHDRTDPSLATLKSLAGIYGTTPSNLLK